MMENSDLLKFINLWLSEDIGDGDHSSVASIPGEAAGKAKLIVKDKGILAGIRIALLVFNEVDKSLKPEVILNDGSEVNPGDIAFYVSGRARSILKSERLVLNILQRMSGIATNTRLYTDHLKGFKTRILDTRKTAPGLRRIEKEAVRIGGGYNHRMGLYDMIMLKDNHIDYAGGIAEAIKRTKEYLEVTGKKLKIEIEARNLNDIDQILAAGGVDRIMLDNFSIENTRKAVEMINGRFETESSGGITIENIGEYAACGVDFISVGALTHHVKSLDMSLKAIKD
jgi:nicotinate-nucleotide pyrophosphorylase (carboxylating)